MKKKTKKRLKNNIKDILIVGLVFLTLFVTVLAANWVNPASNNSGLLSFFHFNDMDLTDSVGNNDFSTGDESFARGKYSTGLNITQMKVISNPNLYNITDYGNLTIEFWYKYETIGDGGQQNFIFAGSSTEYLTFYQIGNTLTIQSSFPGGGFKSRGTAVNQWTHVAMVWKNGNSLTFYLNGTNVSETTGGNAVDWAGEPFRLGHPVQTGGMNITIDSLLIWNVTRTEAEILSDMAGANDADRIKVKLLFPANSSDILMGNFLNFSGNITSSGLANLTNATLQIWDTSEGLKYSQLNNLTGLGITNTTNYTLSVRVGNYKWNILGCGNMEEVGSICESQTSNFTFRIGFVEGTQTYDSSLMEFSEGTMLINVTYDDTFFDSITGILVYNNTAYAGTKVYTQGNNLTFSKTIVSPNVNSNQNIPFFWKFQLTNSSGTSFFFNSTINTQTVSPLSIDDCSVNTVLLLNYSLKDEETQAPLNNFSITNTTVEIEVILRSNTDPTLNDTFSTIKNNIEPSRICIGNNLSVSTYLMDVQTKYSTTDHVVEYNNIQNFVIKNTTIPININLLDLLTTDSQEFLITYKDENFIPVPNALINIQRKYLSEGLFKTVEIPKTDADGQTLGHLVLGDVIYTFSVTKDGRLLAIFFDRVVFCENQATGDCKISLNAPSGEFGGGQIFEGADDINYTLTFNQTTKVISSTFTIISGSSATIQLNGTQFSNSSNILCSTTINAPGGTINCNIPSSFGNGTVIGSLYKDGQLITQKGFIIRASSESVFGATRVIFTMLLFMTLVLLAVSGGGVIALLGGVMGIIFAALLNIIEGGSFFGISATLLWLVLAAGILIWKTSTR